MTMMERLLCRVGLHVWSAWTDIVVKVLHRDKDIVMFQERQSRKCESCHFEQRQRP